MLPYIRFIKGFVLIKATSQKKNLKEYLNFLSHRKNNFSYDYGTLISFAT